jgi:hypothetical protein
MAEEITTIGIVTKNRLPSLERCIRSLLDNCREHNRIINFVVADQSEDYETRLKTKDTLRRISSEFNQPIFYAGLEEKRAFVSELIKLKNLPEDVLNFALLGTDGFECSTGANRNSLFLQCAGKMFLSFDDDTECNIRTKRTVSDSLKMSTKDPQNLLFLNSREEVTDYTSPSDKHSSLRGYNV